MFFCNVLSPDKMFGHQLLLKFQSQEERGKVFPLQVHFKFKYLHRKYVLASQFEANKGAVLGCLENRCPKALDVVLEFLTRIESIYFS